MKPKYATFVPHSAGRYAAKRFQKAQCPIVEHIVNSLMMHGRNNGKKLMAARIVRHAMDIIFLLTDQNPLQVVVDAIINAGPREDAIASSSAWRCSRQAVDISPLRRVNDAIYLLTTGAREAAFRNVKTMAECLADELVNAAKGSSNSRTRLRRRTSWKESPRPTDNNFTKVLYIASKVAQKAARFLKRRLSLKERIRERCVEKAIYKVLRVSI